MKTILIFVLSFAAFAQTTAVPATPTAASLPTYVGGGAAFNQIGQPRWNLWASAIYPVSNAHGVYLSTTTDIVPVQVTDPLTKRLYWGFTTQIRQGAHKTVLERGKLTVLLGGDAGVGMSQASPSGINVNFAGGFTATAVYKLSASWSLAVPVRALYIGQTGNWNVIPEFGILFKP